MYKIIETIKLLLIKMSNTQCFSHAEDPRFMKQSVQVNDVTDTVQEMTGMTINNSVVTAVYCLWPQTSHNSLLFLKFTESNTAIVSALCSTAACKSTMHLKTQKWANQYVRPLISSVVVSTDFVCWWLDSVAIVLQVLF